MDLFRQGDILLRQVSTDPQDEQYADMLVKERDNGRCIVAYGEVTGHAHEVDSETAEILRTTEETEQEFLRIMETAGLVHDEHETLSLPQGIFAIVRQREHDPGPFRQPDRTRFVSD